MEYLRKKGTQPCKTAELYRLTCICGQASSSWSASTADAALHWNKSVAATLGSLLSVI